MAIKNYNSNIMSELDLDIDHYEVSDLETFFRLPKKYDEHEIAKKENEIRTLLLSSGHIAPHFKRGLILFLEEGKKRLIQAKITVKAPTTIKNLVESNVPDNFPVPNIPLPKREENVILPKETSYLYTQPSEYFPGTLNPLDRRTLQKCITIDSRFRTKSTSSTDFTVTLPSKIQKVLSLECVSFEIERHCLYNISSSLGNNYFYLSVCTKEKEYNQIFVIPNGHYDNNLLLETLNNMFAEQTNTPFMFLNFKMDPNESGKCILMIDENENYYSQKINHISMDFTIDIDGNPDKHQDHFTRLGYVLGFTKKKYTNKCEYMTEIPIRMSSSLPYFYLSLDDFQNRSVACFQPAFSQITMPPSILSRMSLREKEPVEVLSTPRKYFGPVDLTRFQVRLLDPLGKVLNIDSNFSFCLVVHTVYDL